MWSHTKAGAPIQFLTYYAEASLHELLSRWGTGSVHTTILVWDSTQFSPSGGVTDCAASFQTRADMESTWQQRASLLFYNLLLQIKCLFLVHFVVENFPHSGILCTFFKFDSRGTESTIWRTWIAFQHQWQSLTIPHSLLWAFPSLFLLVSMPLWLYFLQGYCSCR